jgi:hypothetical protein
VVGEKRDYRGCRPRQEKFGGECLGRWHKYLGPSSVDTLISTQEYFLVPITSIAHESLVSERDETEQYVGKEILVVRKDYKGW